MLSAVSSEGALTAVVVTDFNASTDDEAASGLDNISISELHQTWVYYSIWSQFRCTHTMHVPRHMESWDVKVNTKQNKTYHHHPSYHLSLPVDSIVSIVSVVVSICHRMHQRPHWQPPCDRQSPVTPNRFSLSPAVNMWCGLYQHIYGGTPQLLVPLTNNVIRMPLLRQNDVVTSFWRNNDIIIRLYVTS